MEENDVDKNKNKDENKDGVEENVMNSENDTRNYILNKTFVAVSWLAVSSFLFYKHLYLLFALYSAFFVLFPIAYIFLKFGISDCINKPYIIDKGMDENAMMLFRDEKKNIRVSEFISKEMLNANFWIVIASMIIVYVGMMR